MAALRALAARCKKLARAELSDRQRTSDAGDNEETNSPQGKRLYAAKKLLRTRKTALEKGLALVHAPAECDVLLDAIAFLLRVWLSPILVDVGMYVLDLSLTDARPWALGSRASPREAEALAEAISRVLFNGEWKDPAANWQDLHIRSRTEAVARRHLVYSLAGCDGSFPIEKWLYRVSVGGDLRTKANAFRKALVAFWMLGCFGEELQSGRILRCRKCKEEPNLSNGCACHDSLPRVKEANWWLFRKGTRVCHPAWRCAKCKCFFFRLHPDLPCPSCRKHRWSKRPTLVWVRITPVGLEDDDPEEA